MRGGLGHGLVVVVSRHILVLGSCSRSLVESESRLDPESATKSESRSNLTFFFYLQNSKNPRFVPCLEYWCIGLGIKLRGEGGCESLLLGGPPAALPNAAGSPPTFGIVVKVRNRKRRKEVGQF